MRHKHHTKTRIIVTWIVALVIAVGLFLPVYLTSENINLGQLDLKRLSDATFIPAALLLGMAVLVLLTRAGTFDIVGYSFAAIGARFRPRELRRYKDAYDYKVQAEERRRTKGGFILPFIIVGGILMVIAIVSNIVFVAQVS